MLQPNENRPGYKQTPVGWIPNDWKLKRLGGLGSFKKGKGISMDVISDEGFPCIMYGDIYVKYNVHFNRTDYRIDKTIAQNSTQVKKGDLLFTTSGETAEEIGKCVTYQGDEEIYIGGDIIGFTPRNQDSLFIAYQQNGYNQIKQKTRLGQGYSVVHIYLDHIKSLLIPLPSLSEQRKIAAILSTWDEAIQQMDRLIEKKRELKKGLMQRLITREMRLPGYTKEWKQVSLNDCSLGKGEYGLNAAACDYKVGLPRYIRITDIDDRGRYISTNEVYVDSKYSDQYYLHLDDLLFVRTGATVGKNYLYNERDGELVFAGFLIRFSIDSNKYNSEFIKNACDTDAYWAWVKKVSARSGQPGINANEYGKYSFAIPSLLEEQNAIANILSTADREIQLLVKKRDQLLEQKKVLMQLLLTGIVRVKK